MKSWKKYMLLLVIPTLLMLMFFGCSLNSQQTTDISHSTKVARKSIKIGNKTSVVKGKAQRDNIILQNGLPDGTGAPPPGLHAKEKN